MSTDGDRGILSRPGSRALLVGCGHHATGSRLPDVPAVGRTILDLGQALANTCQLAPSQLAILTNPPSPREIGVALTESAAAATDTLLIYYVGHGLVGADRQLYLATLATTDLNRGIASHQALAYADILPVIAGSPARLAVIVLDCCFSGRAYGQRTGDGGEAFNATRRHGIYLMTATGSDELAWAPDGERHTSFTGELISLLERGDPTGPPWLTLDSIYRALDRALQAKGAPRPRRQAADTGDTQLFTLNRAYQAPAPMRLPGLVSADDQAPSPYQGLKPFRAADAPYFFGREAMTEQLRDRVASWDGRLIVVTGPSGSGKSSLLCAGLVATIENGTVAAVARSCVLFTPGADPVGRVSRGLRAAQEASGTGSVVVVDQLEELFTAGASEAERQAFITELAGAAEDRPVVLGLRADFFGHFLRYPSLVQALERPVIVGPMSQTELAEAIEGPARLAGLSLQEGLSDRLLHDLGALDSGSTAAAAGTLPLLSHALLATWQHRAGGALTLDSYFATGGIDGAVAQTADTIVRNLPEAERAVVRWLLTRMVRIGDGTDHSRRRVPLDELLPPDGDTRRAARRAVLDQFIAARLVTADDDTVTITHEALIRAWPALSAWIDEDFAGLLLRQQLIEAAAAWESEGRDPAALYRGQRLAVAADWAAEPGHLDDLGERATRFLQASLAHDAAARLAARRRGRQRRVVAGALAVLLLVAALAGGAAWQQRRTAAAAERTATAGRLVNLSGELRTSHPRTALMLAVAAAIAGPSAEVRASLLQTLTESQYFGTLGAAHGMVSSLNFSSTGWLATSDGATVSIWNVSSRRRLGKFEPTGQHVASVAFSPGGTILAVSTDTDTAVTVTLWAMSQPRHPRLLAKLPVKGTDGLIWPPVVDFDPAGPLLAASNGALNATLWNISNPSRPRQTARLTSPTGPVYSMAFRPDGRQLAVGSDEETTSFFHVSARGMIRPWSKAVFSGAPSGGVYAVGYNPEGTIFAAASGPDVRLWDLANPSRPVVYKNLDDQSATIEALAFSRQGNLVTVGQDGGGYVYTRGSGGGSQVQSAVLSGSAGGIYAVAFSPDGSTIATGDAAGEINLWRTRSLAQPQPFAVAQTVHAYNSAAYSPGGTELVAAGADSTLESWDTAGFSLPAATGSTTVPTDNGTQAHLATIGESGVTSAAFSPDGRLFATSSFEHADFGGLAMIWAVTASGPFVRKSVLGGKTAYDAVAFSPDGRLLAAGATTVGRKGSVGVVVLTNVSDPVHPHQVAVIRTRSTAVNSVAFDSQGDLLAVGLDSGAGLWDVRNPARPRSLAAVTTQGTSGSGVALSSNGRLLAVGDEDGSATLWDVADPARPVRLSVLDANTGRLESVRFSPNGKELLTAGDDRTAVLWDIADPADPVLLATLAGDTRPVYAIFGPADTEVTTASQDGQVQWWNLADLASAESRPVALACSILGQVRRAEWSPYVTAAIGDRICEGR